MPPQNISECTRVVRFVDCIGEGIYYFEIQEMKDDAKTEQAAVDRFRKIIGYDPYERCAHCGDRLYSSYLLDDDETVPDRSMDYFFPLE